MLLSVPPRRSFDRPEVRRGEELFADAGCASCHRTTIDTGRVHPMAGLCGQAIQPYTDLLLHDLGPELADDFSEGDAEPSEWRTAPLWGIGRVDDVDPNVTYLHDGRARTLAEAILWHGGEAGPSRDRFVALSASDREALLTFLDSL